MSKKTVAVVFGSRSPEHDVSIVTAVASVVKPLKLAGFGVVPVYIAKDGRWFAGEELADIKTYQTGRIEEIIMKQKPVALSLGGGLRLIGGSGIRKKEWKIDVVFPATHGAYGEDGSLMGLLRMAGVAYVGCDMEASVVAMNKVLAKQVAEANGILTPKYLSFLSDEFELGRKAVVKKILSELKLPVFVKPPHLGSSIGITRVANKEELENALEVAAYYDDVILVEEAVGNLIEVTVPVMGNEEPFVAMVERPVRLGDGEFFDFESKYINEGGKKSGGKKGAQGYSEIPAKLPGKLYERCEEVAREVYLRLGLTGISRVDLLIDSKAKKVYFNEVNPLPGGLYAHNFARAGVSNVELVKRLVRYAEERFERQGRVKTTFDTNYLKQF